MGRNLVIGPEVGHWTASRVEGSFWEDNSRAIGLAKDGELVAGAIYENWNGRSMVCHLAIEGRINREFLWTIFDYPFNQIGAQKIIAPVASSNAKSTNLVLNMGFVEEARLSDSHPTGDLVFFTMKKPGCRFLGVRYGKEFAKSAASA